MVFDHLGRILMISIEKVVETLWFFCSCLKPWHSVPQWFLLTAQRCNQRL